MSTLVFHVRKERLVWDGEEYEAVSGPYGKGPLPPGMYDVKTKHVVSNTSLPEGFRHSASGTAFFIPIWPQESVNTTRDGFGIHPDGNTHGTLGCVGLQGSESPRFWQRWKNTPMNKRPTLLEVEDRTINLFPVPVNPISKV